MDVNSWQYRAVKETRGSQTQMGALVLAIIGKQRNTLPQYPHGGIISQEGNLHATLIKRDVSIELGALVMPLKQFLLEWEALVNKIKCTTEERAEMYLAARVWIANDLRKNKEEFLR